MPDRAAPDRRPPPEPVASALPSLYPGPPVRDNAPIEASVSGWSTDRGIVHKTLHVAAEHADSYLVGHEPSRDLHGRDGIRHSLADFRNAFPDIRVTVEDLVTEGDRMVARWSFRGTQRGEVLGVAPTDGPVTVTGMIFYRISEDGISEYWGSWDRMGLLQQLDALPRPQAYRRG